MYAVISDRGNQITVTEGEVLEIDLLDAAGGDEIIFDNVLMISNDSGVTLGKPAVEGVRVVAEVVCDTKGKKVYGLSFRRRKSSKVRKGHRQKYTKIKINKIEA